MVWAPLGQVWVPVSAPIGQWQVTVVTWVINRWEKNIFKKRKYFSKIFRAGVSREHRVESPIYVLFNPWLPDDPTHMSR